MRVPWSLWLVGCGAAAPTPPAETDTPAETGRDVPVETAATDTPFLPADLVARLKAAAQAPIALAESDGWLHPTFGLWPVTLAEDLELALEAGTRKVAGWALGEGAVRVRFADEPFDPFFNINTPGDLEKAERILAGERT